MEGLNKQYRKLEICCYSAESAILAENAGADRIELCDNYSEGGTTPSFATIKLAVEKLDIPVNVIIRPRGGDFLYSDLEFEIMKEEVLELKKIGVHGFVFGILTSEGEIDIERTKELIELSAPLDHTFHRAFDMCRNQLRSLEQLKKLGINRVLTSGGKNNAHDGMELIAKLVEAAEDTTIIMPGSGINEHTIGEILERTRATEFHSSAKTFIHSGMQYYNPDIKLGKANNIDEYMKVGVSSEQIEKMKSILNI